MLKLQPSIIVLLFMSLISLSAKTSTTEPLLNTPVTETTAANPLAASTVGQHKLNFFERVIQKLGIKKYRVADTEKADRRAKSSLIFGIVAAGTLLLGFVAPILFLLTIPAGLVAILNGSSALNSETTLTAKAKTGKALGIGALIGLVVLVVVAVIAVASVFGG